MSLDKGRAARVLEVGTRREKTGNEEMTLSQSHHGDVISISTQQLAKIMKIVFLPSNPTKGLDDLAKALGGFEGKILLSKSAQEVILSADKIDEIANGVSAGKNR